MYAIESFYFCIKVASESSTDYALTVEWQNIEKTQSFCNCICTSD